MGDYENALPSGTAIADLLQDKVPETIAALRRANIRFWMLTGDKKSTAETIAQTCNIIKREDPLLDIDAGTPAAVGPTQAPTLNPAQ